MSAQLGSELNGTDSGCPGGTAASQPGAAAVLRSLSPAKPAWWQTGRLEKNRLQPLWPRSRLDKVYSPRGRVKDHDAETSTETSTAWTENRMQKLEQEFRISSLKERLTSSRIAMRMPSPAPTRWSQVAPDSWATRPHVPLTLVELTLPADPLDVSLSHNLRSFMEQMSCPPYYGKKPCHRNLQKHGCYTSGLVVDVGSGPILKRCFLLLLHRCL